MGGLDGPPKPPALRGPAEPDRFASVLPDRPLDGADGRGQLVRLALEVAVDL